MEISKRGKLVIKVGIIGCGKIAGAYNLKNIESHGYVIKKLNKFKLISCYDISKKIRNKFSYYYKCKPQDTISSLLDDKLDIVTICTPDHTHYKIALEIIKNINCPKIIFIEKPVCETELQFKKLQNSIKKKKVKIVVNHSRRFNEKLNKLKKLIINNFFGNYICGNATYYKGWKHNGVHIVDTLIYLLEDKISILNINNIKESSIPDDPTLDVSLCIGKKIEENFTINSFDDNLYQVFDIDLFFEKGRIRINNFEDEINVYKKYVDKYKRKKIKKIKLFDKDNHNYPLENAYNLFKNYLKTDNNKLIKDVDLDSSFKTMKVIWSGVQARKKKTSRIKNGKR
tara:strand:+ start:39 stop:1064 length:1026 start_codon:yes stop_codon:yes gene_type:complete